jgi:hypothetical protein
VSRLFIREGRERGAGRYMSTFGWKVRRENAGDFSLCTHPKDRAAALGGRLVRILSHDEAKQKAEAKGRNDALAEVLAMLKMVGERGRGMSVGEALGQSAVFVMRMMCPCQGPLDACPWKDPDYEPKGGMW